MRVVIDVERCSGHGRCYSLVPELFEPDDEGHGVVCATVNPESQLAEVMIAVGNCPEKAISVFSEDQPNEPEGSSASGFASL
jgi:ferredoxin